MIGIFDSGSGGLSVLSEFTKLAPLTSIVYFGDIKNAPYGIKSREALGALTVLGFEKLIAEGATGIISACNSVSASIALPMFDILGIEPRAIIEMVGPTVEHFKGNQSKRVLIVATPATISSGIYRIGFESIHVPVMELAIPELALAIEQGRPREELDRIVEHAFSPLPAAFDTVLLACTHYPFAKESFERALYRKKSDAVIVDPATFVAQRAKERFAPADETGGEEGGEVSFRFIISAESTAFRERVAALFPNTKYTIEILEAGAK